MTFRLRLTLLYSGLIALAMVLFSGALFGIFRYTFLYEVDNTLRATATDIAVPVSRNRIPDLERIRDRSTFAQVRTETQVVAQAGIARGLFPLPEKAKAGQITFTDEVDSDNVPLRLYTLPLLGQDGQPFIYVQVAYSLTLLNTVSRTLLAVLPFGTLLFLGLGAAGAWWVSRRAIAPIESVALAAQAIGSSQDLSLRVPDPGTEDEVGMLVTTFNDMLDQLQGLYGRLAASVDAQQRFVADASHELRTPLTIIRGNIDYMKKAGRLDPEAMADIQSEAERMSRLVDELLTLARADAGQMPEMKPIALGPLVADACRKAQALPHQVEFHTELPEALARVMVNGHAEWITRVLLILIENAFKYTPSGSVTVRAGRQGNGVVVQVSDTGPGIAPEDLPHIFERFYRADRARSRGGTGLGLAIAQWIAGVHGGTLKAESELGKGTTFSFWLPVA